MRRGTQAEAADAEGGAQEQACGNNLQLWKGEVWEQQLCGAAIVKCLRKEVLLLF